MPTCSFQPNGSQWSRSGRLIKLQQLAHTDTNLAMNYPSKRAAIERSRGSVKRTYQSARVNVIKDLKAPNAQLASKVAESQRCSLVLSFNLSKCSTSEFEELVKASYGARKVLQSRGWIMHWEARDMAHAIWVDKIKLYPGKYPLNDGDLGIELPLYHPRVASATIKQLLLLLDQRGGWAPYSPNAFCYSFGLAARSTDT